MATTRTPLAHRLAVFLALAVLLALPARGNHADLNRVSFSHASSRSGLVVRFHFSGRVSSFSLERDDDTRLLRVAAVSATVDGSFSCDDPVAPIEDCSVLLESGRLYIELRLASVATIADLYRDGENRSDLLLYVEAPERQAGADAARPAPVAPPSLLPATEPSNPSDANPDVVRDVTEEIAESARQLHIDTVVIDAGHGGKDPGTIGHGGLREKDVVLEIALLVGSYLEERAGIRVVFTRDDDTFIELADRGKMALEAGGKLFISIHANSAPSSRARGTETFFLGRNKTEGARLVVERENSVIAQESDRDRYADYDPAALVRVRLTQSSNLRQSQDLAARIQAQYRDRVGRRDRGVKEGNLYVLWSSGMPSILTEIGFISNPNEARFLRSNRGKDYIASAIFRAVRDYIEEYERSLDVASAR